MVARAAVYRLVGSSSLSRLANVDDAGVSGRFPKPDCRNWMMQVRLLSPARIEVSPSGMALGLGPSKMRVRLSPPRPWAIGEIGHHRGLRNLNCRSEFCMAHYRPVAQLDQGARPRTERLPVRLRPGLPRVGLPAARMLVSKTSDRGSSPRRPACSACSSVWFRAPRPGRGGRLFKSAHAD
jgi:hypothetical protein